MKRPNKDDQKKVNTQYGKSPIKRSQISKPERVIKIVQKRQKNHLKYVYQLKYHLTDDKFKKIDPNMKQGNKSARLRSGKSKSNGASSLVSP